MNMLNGVGPNSSHKIALLVTEYQLNIELLSNSLWGQLCSQLYIHLMVYLSSPYCPNLASRSLQESMLEACCIEEGDVPVIPCPPSLSSLQRRQAGLPSLQGSKLQVCLCHILFCPAHLEPDGASLPAYLLLSRSVTR